MSYQSLLKLGLQLIGLSLVLEAIIDIPRAIGLTLLFRNQPAMNFPILPQLISIVLMAFLGYLVIHHASKISGLFITSDEQISLNVKKEEIVEIVIITVGILVIFGRVPNIYPSLASMAKGESLSLFINTVVTSVIALALILKARVISTFLLRITEKKS